MKKITGYQKHLNSEKLLQKYKKENRYLACWAGYYDKSCSKSKKEYIRFTCTITDLKTDKIIDAKEWWGGEGFSMDKAMEEMNSLITIYEITTVHRLAELVELERCKDCDKYVYQQITSENIHKGYCITTK